MGRMIFIENLTPKVTAEQLSDLISQHGDIESIELAKDDKTEEDTKVAFVSMKSAKHGRAVIAALNGKTHWERPLSVKALKQHHESLTGQSSPGGGPVPGGLGRRFGGRGSMYGHGSRGMSGGRNS